MSAHTGAEMMTLLEHSIMTLDAANLTDEQMYRAMMQAISEMSRYYPQQAVSECPIVEESSETFTALTTDWVSLTGCGIKWDTEAVEDSDGNACTRNTDYYMDYFNGRIKAIAGGEIADEEEDCTISYDFDRITVDVSENGIMGADRLIKVKRVEYPVGNIPQQFVAFSHYGNSPAGMSHVIIESERDGKSQSQMTVDRNAAIYYDQMWAANIDIAGTSTTGAWPDVFDESIITSAQSFIARSQCMRFLDLATAAIADALTAAAAMELTQDDIDAMITAVIDILTSGTPNAVDLIKAINDDVDNHRKKILASCSSAEGYIADAIINMAAGDTAINSAITTYANAITVGDKVAEKYISAGRALQESAMATLNIAQVQIASANARIASIQQFIEQSQSITAVANSYIAATSVLVQTMSTSVQDIKAYLDAGIHYVEIAEKYRLLHVDLRNEAIGTWSRLGGFGSDMSTTSLRQR